MFIISNLISAIAQVIDILITAYIFIIVARVFVSWVNADPYNPIVRFLYQATEPVLFRIRRYIPCVWGGIDFSPLLLLIFLTFIRTFLLKTLFDLATRL